MKVWRLLGAALSVVILWLVILRYWGPVRFVRKCCAGKHAAKLRGEMQLSLVAKRLELEYPHIRKPWRWIIVEAATMRD